MIFIPRNVLQKKCDLHYIATTSPIILKIICLLTDKHLTSVNNGYFLAYPRIV